MVSLSRKGAEAFVSEALAVENGAGSGEPGFQPRSSFDLFQTCLHAGPSHRKSWIAAPRQLEAGE
jgi:hypothetical protein